MKILVIKRDKIGDLLLTTPMLAVLRAALPQAKIHLLANDYNAWVAEGNPNVDKRWVYPRVRTGNKVSIKAAWATWNINRLLKREHFDVAIVGNSAESRRAIERGTALGAKRVIASFPADNRYPGVTDRIDFDPKRHEVEAMIALLAPMGVAAPAQLPYPQFSLPGQWQAEAEQWLASQKLAPKRYVIIGLGARRAKKQPTRDQVLRWSDWFAQKHGLKTVFMWTPGKSDNPLYPGDDEVAQPVLDANSPHIVPFRGALKPAIGLIWNAAFSLFPDSGLMHFAAASPGGVLGLFAETDVSPHPDQWGPRGRRAAYLDAQKAVAELPDELVFSTVEGLLAR
ncbi:MAG TPA: glycosyltransferase family 9 protein [Burkholderiales bacterium]|jgi:ADP-heptose:LPS heptosyltransferase